MAEYHVGCGLFGKIYAGTLKPRNKTLWSCKSDVTTEALSAVAQYLLFNSKKFVFEHKEKRYALQVEEIEGDE